MDKQKIQARIVGKSVETNSSEAHTLCSKSSYGEKKQGKVIYSLYEAFYLYEKGKLEIAQGSKAMGETIMLKKFKSLDKKFSIKYPVFRDLRDKGYVIKTALKFGADFRVYDKGFKPGQSHSKWIVFADHEHSKLSWQEFAAKNRIAHSTKKNLLIALVDEEEDISYYEVKWLKL